MAGEFTPTLTSTDWNEEWKELQRARKHADDPAKWDERAKTYPVKHGSHAGYTDRFLELAQVEPGETVLDMGCGTGALATPLAQMGCHVIACDFSRGMLDKMVEDQRSLGVEGVEARLVSWADDWNASGIEAKSVDVAIASRSIATDNLLDALMRLDRVARRRVCITLPSGPSPRCDERLLEAAGLGHALGKDFLYAFNILASRGIAAEVGYIVSIREELFESPDDALDKLSGIVADAARGLYPAHQIDAIPTHISTWLKDNLLECDEGFRLASPRKSIWAFLAWQPR